MASKKTLKQTRGTRKRKQTRGARKPKTMRRKVKKIRRVRGGARAAYDIYSTLSENQLFVIKDVLRNKAPYAPGGKWMKPYNLNRLLQDEGLTFDHLIAYIKMCKSKKYCLGDGIDVAHRREWPQWFRDMLMESDIYED